MELGNAMFGHSRGTYPVDRSNALLAQFERLAEATDQDTYFSDHVDNDTFSIRSYYWGDCTCGYEERWTAAEKAWSDEHPHATDCYQTELRAEEDRYDTESGYRAIHAAAFGDDETALIGGMDIEFDTVEPVPGLQVTTMVGKPRHDDAMERWREAYRQRETFMDALYARLCKKYKRGKRGCAVHCTCGHDKLYAAFAATDDHAPTCPIVLPNFLFKPTGFELRWYKYPLRDSYSNEKLTVPMLRKMVDECIRSLGKNPEDY